MKKELQNLIDDFGGGRKKESEKSQLFYDIANEVLWKLNERPYSDVEQFTKYLKEVTKKISSVNILGKEQFKYQNT